MKRNAYRFYFDSLKGKDFWKYLCGNGGDGRYYQNGSSSCLWAVVDWIHLTQGKNQ
jgi:hypothetical protein